MVEIPQYNVYKEIILPANKEQKVQELRKYANQLVLFKRNNLSTNEIEYIGGLFFEYGKKSGDFGIEYKEAIKLRRKKLDLDNLESILVKISFVFR